MTGISDYLADTEYSLVERKPFPEQVAPMLATLTHAPFSAPDWIYERKLDGERALAFRRKATVRLRTRNNKDIGDTYPELICTLAQQSGPDFVVDGEIVAFDGRLTSFSRLQRRMQIDDAEVARASPVAVFFYLFDILYFDGYSLVSLPLRRRKTMLRDVVAFHGPLRYVPHRNRDGKSFFEAACEKGWEGIIAKRAASPYRYTRSRDWLKFKCAAGQELVIGGFTEPQGSRVGFGALLVGYYENDRFRYAGKVGTGFDDETLSNLRRRLDGLARRTSPFEDDVPEKGVHWVTPKLVGAFRFTEWTASGKLRHPAFLGLRHDKPASAVVRERPAA